MEPSTFSALSSGNTCARPAPLKLRIQGYSLERQQEAAESPSRSRILRVQMGKHNVGPSVSDCSYY